MAFSGHNLGESFVGVLTPKDGKPVNIILPIRFPAFDKMRKGEVVITVADYKTRYYTGLQVTRDPGVWIVYLGFVVMIAGCFITFFVAHERICVEIERRGEKAAIAVSGMADKNFTGMENKVKKISEKLAAMIKERK
jgi:cytochrome c biogenesis protein